MEKLTSFIGIAVWIPTVAYYKNNYIFFNSASGKTIPEIQKQLGITSYTSEYFDKDFNIIAYAEPETDSPTQAPTKKSAENKQVQQ